MTSATITVAGVRPDVTAGADGTFRFTLAPGTYSVRVRAVGFLPRDATVMIAEGQSTTLDVALEPRVSVLDEVIVTGTVVPTERKAIATPITVIHAEDIEKRGITRIEELFRGDVPGLLALDRGALAYAARPGLEGAGVRTDLYTRGSADLGGGANPIKTYVDGVELLDPSYLGTIDPRSIERIEIITGPQASTIYGSGAMGGVMQIFTKKGSGRRASEIKLHARYGILQNNYSDGQTPEHHDVISVDGGTGPEFSYTGTLSYDYQGQWQPKLYNRGWGTSFGITHTRDALTVSGSVSATGNTRGTWDSDGQPGYGRHKIMYSNDAGIQNRNVNLYVYSDRISKSSNQNVAANMAYRLTPQWNHQLTIGRVHTRLALEPKAPEYDNATNVGADSLFKSSQTSGERTTWGYNTSYRSSPQWVSSVLIVGANGSSGSSLQATGCQVSASASTIVGCSAGQAPNVSIPLSSSSWGAFGSWQVGLWGQLYTTFGVRMEQNPNYGRQVKFDVTPTNGLTYTFTVRDVSLKLMGSYGRATRPPKASQRDERITNDPVWNPPQFIAQFANPDLRPEYSRGPQGGIELFWGNLGSLSVNHYQQTVSDLIQLVYVDSIWREYPGIPLFDQWTKQMQYINIAKVRQQGWEGTAAVNAGPFSMKGSYSWSDSRVLAVDPTIGSTYRPGQSFRDLPTHTGSATLGFARGQTSLMVVTNYIGATISLNSLERVEVAQFSKPRGPYAEIEAMRAGQLRLERHVSGYTRTNIMGSHRLSHAVSLTLNIVNAGNNFQSDDVYANPTLGRQTTLGIMYRFGRR